MITSTRNSTVKWVRRLQADRKTRWRDGMMVLEGSRLVGEALAAEIPIHTVLHTTRLAPEDTHLVQGLAEAGAQVKAVSAGVMAACSDTESPQGLLVVAPFPEISMPERLTLVLVADRLADPGNLGTLMRAAWAAGGEALFLTEGSVDAYNPKVVRAAMGAHFTLPILTVEAATLRDRLRKLDVWLAEARAGMRYDQVDWTRPSALIIGGEAYGPQERVRDLAGKSVHIPMSPGADSLNAAIAGAVILFEIVRQRGKP
jgi:TrmH family RNA methyltransferase